MSKHAVKSADGEGFLRAFTDAWVDLEKTYDCHLYCVMSPTGRRGIVRLALQALCASERGDEQVIASYSVEYPSAQVGTFEACVYQCVVRLERVVRDAVAYPGGKG